MRRESSVRPLGLRRERCLDFTLNFSVGEVCPRLGKERRLKTFQCLFVCPLQRECGVYLDPFTAGAGKFSEQTYMPANQTFSAGNQTFFE